MCEECIEDPKCPCTCRHLHIERYVDKEHIYSLAHCYICQHNQEIMIAREEDN